MSHIPTADQRSADILESVRSTFAQKGFDGASMQDLARAAGMSVGNFYRYFPSKSAIVEALIALDLAEMERDFRHIIHSPRPLEALRLMLRDHIPQHQCANDGQLWAEITAAALRKPEIGSVCLLMETTIVGYLTTVFGAETGLPAEEAKQRFSAHAMFIIMLVKASAALETGTNGDLAHLNAMIFRSIDQTLDEIASFTLKV